MIRHNHPATVQRFAVTTMTVLIAVLLLAGRTAAAPPETPESREANIATFNEAAEAAGALGTYWDENASQMVAVMPNAAARSVVPIDTGKVAFRVEIAAVDPARIDSVLGDLLTLSKKVSSTYGFYFLPEIAKVVVEVTGPTSEFDALAARYAGLIEVRSAPEGGRESYFTDPTPHHGGAHLRLIRGSFVIQCTSGFVVKKAGVRYMTTAGHCFNLGEQPFSPGNGDSFGTVQFRGTYPQIDAELIGLGIYAPSIYTGNFPGLLKNVLSAADPIVGASEYCVSGSYTYGNCSFEVTALNGVLCDPPGVCTGNLIVYCCGTGITHLGDSGGPFYIQGSNYANIRGMHVGRKLSSMYATKWTTIANTFGATICGSSC